MGFLHYGTEAFPMEDRALMHVQITLHELLRQKATFYLTWIKPKEQGSGRISLLISPGVHLMFSFEGSRVPRINPTWIQDLIAHATTGTGLVLLPEPAPNTTSTGRPTSSTPTSG